MQTYWAQVTFIVGPHQEKSLNIEFKAKNRKAAVEDAYRFARNREKNLEGWILSCLKVGRFKPEPIDQDGYYRSGSWLSFFDWKYDWPGTIEERIESLLEKE